MQRTPTCLQKHWVKSLGRTFDRKFRVIYWRKSRTS